MTINLWEPSNHAVIKYKKIIRTQISTIFYSHTAQCVHDYIIFFSSDSYDISDL